MNLGTSWRCSELLIPIVLLTGGIPASGANLAAPQLSLVPTFYLDDVPPENPGAASEPTSPVPPSYGITGNWFGARDHFAKNHIYFGGYILAEVSKVVRGGLDTEAWPVGYLLDLHVIVDTDGALGWKGGMMFLDFQSHDQSENGDTTVGDIQGVDNIDSVRFVQVMQLWYKQSFGDSLRLKVGKIDINSDTSVPGADANDGFSLIEHSTEFRHSAAVYTPTMFAMVTYPDPAPGAQLFFGQSGPYAGAGAFYSNSHQTFLDISGQPESIERTDGGMFFIAEGGTRWKLADKPGHAAVGGWYHRGEFPRIANPNASAQGAGGGYFFIDQTLIHEEQEGQPVRDLGVFFHTGLADKTTSPMDESLTIGISGRGFVPYRPDDSIGVLGSWVHIPAQPGLLHPFEFAAEIYYKLQITPWASLKPVFQYVVNPSGMHPDAAVISLRAEVDF